MGPARPASGSSTAPTPTRPSRRFFGEDRCYPDPLGRTLRPERLRTSEIVYEQYVGGTLRLTATGYLTTAKT